METPEAVAGLNDPQAADPQVAVQITPAFKGSFATFARRSAVVLISMELGGGTLSAIATGEVSTVRVMLLLCDGLLVTVAVMATVVPIGAADGAVKIVVAPSAVCAGASVPHAPFVTLPLIGLPPQVTVQSMPAFRLSPVGIMLSFAVVPMTTAVTASFVPVGFAMTIGPAFAPELAWLPHPTAIMPITTHRQR
jgi:hypothetical protein